MLRIGTCGGKAALWQAEFTRAELRRIGVASEVVLLKTQGPLQRSDAMEANRLLTKAIADALLRGVVDLAVQPMQDLPASRPEGLVITAVSYRDNPAELLLIRPEAVTPGQIFKLKPGAVAGISTPRRKAQMRYFRPDVELQDLIDDASTQLEQLRRGKYDAVLLAAASVVRLGLDIAGLEAIELNPREFVPAPAQGVLAWQTHRDDLRTRRILKPLHHPEVSAATNVERRVLQLMGGDSQLPLGVYATRDSGGNYHAFAAFEKDGTLRHAQVSQSTNYGLAERLVERLG